MGTITPLSSAPSDYTVLTTDYVGNMIYENGALKEILLPEGYYQNGTFYYYLKDHLGDNRVTINSSGTVVEKSHYYPSGTRFFTESTSNTLKPLPYRYNGKELEAMNGLNQMDYGARRRFAGLPIWTSVDPLAEKYYSISPYAYCAGNPINRFDPDGMDWYTSTDGKTTYWQEGNKKVDGYTNSETNTQKNDDNTSITYTQNDATSITFTGIDKSDYVSQTGKTGCKVASDKMLANDGVNSNGKKIDVVNADANGVATTPTKSANKGIKAVDNALENGKPIEVGVDYSPEQLHNKKPNGDGMTDHFVVVSSKTETLDNGQVTSTNYNFFDPRQKAYGTNSLNILTRQNDMLKGAFHGTRIIPYTVTTVRTSSR